MAGVVFCRAVDIDHNLQAIVFHLLHDDIKDFHAVFQRLSIRFDKILVGVDIGTGLGNGTVFAYLVCRRLIAGIYGADRIRCSAHPGNQQLCGDWHTNQVDTVVTNRFQKGINVCGVQSVCTIFRTVKAKPVRTGKPYLVPFRIVQTASVCMEPVVIIIIRSSSFQIQLCHRWQTGRNTGDCQCPGCQKCQNGLLQFHKSKVPFLCQFVFKLQKSKDFSASHTSFIIVRSHKKVKRIEKKFIKIEEISEIISFCRL